MADEEDESTVEKIDADEVSVLEPLDSITGVKPKVASSIAKMLREGRRYFGSAGASLTHQAHNPEYADKGVNASSAKIGLEGERSTSLMLREWIEDKPGAVLIDSAHIRGWGKEELDEETGVIDGGDTDHLLVIGTEVILIDTKRWKSKKKYTVDDDGSVLRSGQPFPGGKVRPSQARHLWLNYLESGAKVTSFICINAENVEVFRYRPWYKASYRLVESDRLFELLDVKYNAISYEDKTKINSTLISQIVVSCVKPYDERVRVFDMESLRRFQEGR